MRNQSKMQEYQLERIIVPADFPVSVPDFNTRDENPMVHPHIHDLFEIGYCYAGSGVFLIGDKLFPFHAGNAVVINTHEVHIAKADPGKTARWGFLNLNPLRLLAEIPGSYGGGIHLEHCCGPAFRNIIEENKHPELVLCIRRIVEECRDRKRNYRPLVRALVWQMLLELERYAPGETEETQTTADYRDIARILPALNRIGSNFNMDLEIPLLAKLCYTSEPNFRKLFHRAMGCAPQRYLLNMRLNVAMSMLCNSDTAILEIAVQSGFRTLSNFNRQFQARFGCSPRTMRKKNKSPGLN